MDDSNDFIRDIERFADRHNLSETGVSRMLASNPNFLTRLRAGGEVYSKTERRIRREMKEHDILTGAAHDSR